MPTKDLEITVPLSYYFGVYIKSFQALNILYKMWREGRNYESLEISFIVLFLLSIIFMFSWSIIVRPYVIHSDWGVRKKENSLIQDFKSVYRPKDWWIAISLTRNKVKYWTENRYVNMMITIDGEQKREHGS